jgi:hypothetical protein
MDDELTVSLYFGILLVLGKKSTFHLLRNQMLLAFGILSF